MPHPLTVIRSRFADLRRVYVHIQWRRLVRTYRSLSHFSRLLDDYAGPYDLTESKLWRAYERVARKYERQARILGIEDAAALLSELMGTGRRGRHVPPVPEAVLKRFGCA